MWVRIALVGMKKENNFTFLCEKTHFEINILKYYVFSLGEVSSLKISSQNGLAW